MERDRFLAYLVQVATHVGMLPSIAVTYKKKRPEMFAVGIATILTSFLYHIAEVMSDKRYYPSDSFPLYPHKVLLLGMTDGQWHRLDNVFAILTFQLLLLYFMGLTKWWYHFWTWICVALTMWCQEIGPWKIQFTIIPIAVPGVALIVFSSKVETAGVDVDLVGKYLAWGGVAMIGAVFCFYKGLDDEKDYVRAWHGCWHVLAAVAGSLMIWSKPNIKED